MWKRFDVIRMLLKNSHVSGWPINPCCFFRQFVVAVVKCNFKDQSWRSFVHLTEDILSLLFQKKPFQKNLPANSLNISLKMGNRNEYFRHILLFCFK